VLASQRRREFVDVCPAIVPERSAHGKLALLGLLRFAQAEERQGMELYSGSLGSLNSTVSLMLPWPCCGKPGVFGSPGSRFDAVSSGGNSTSDSRNRRTASCLDSESWAKASRDACASPSWRRITSLRFMLRPSWP